MEIALFFIVQSAIIVGAMLTAYIKLRVGLTEVRKDIGFVRENTTGLSDDHAKLLEQVQGISRIVAALEAKAE